MEKNSENSQIKNAKQGQIKMIIYHGFTLDENFSIFQESNSYNHSEINDLFGKIVSPYESAVDLIKDIEALSQITFYSFKRIYLPKGDSEILFSCSSISPKKLPSEQESLCNLATSANSDGSAVSAIRNLKRENCESCPMRLKFKLDPISCRYQISDDSNFNHNHSCISDSSEVIFGIFYFKSFL